MGEKRTITCTSRKTDPKTYNLLVIEISIPNSFFTLSNANLFPLNRLICTKDISCLIKSICENAVSTMILVIDHHGRHFSLLLLSHILNQVLKNFLGGTKPFHEGCFILRVSKGIVIYKGNIDKSQCFCGFLLSIQIYTTFN